MEKEELSTRPYLFTRDVNMEKESIDSEVLDNEEYTENDDTQSTESDIDSEIDQIPPIKIVEDLKHRME